MTRPLLDPVQVAAELIAIPSVSSDSNQAVSERVTAYLERIGFALERVTYLDDNRALKINLVGKRGTGSGGIGFFCHSDTVPGGKGWDAFTPALRDDVLIGRGACDMKGALAAALAACNRIPASDLEFPIYFVVSSDEESGLRGAYEVCDRSQILAEGWPECGIVTEPTNLKPVNAHKGGRRIKVTAHGIAAHTSTDRGVSANFIIAPFLAEMAGLAKRFRNDPHFQDSVFSPPTNGFNMVIDDGGCQPNVTAERTTCEISVRPMPGGHTREALDLILEAAGKYGLEVSIAGFEPFAQNSDAQVVAAALSATGESRPQAVSFGTEAVVYHAHTDLVVLGPGDIAQAHTVGESVPIAELHRAASIYETMVRRICTQHRSAAT